MVNKSTIPHIMKKHHYQIEGLLNRFKKHMDEFEVFPKDFNKFKWELEKHFFIEERAIFTMIYSENVECNEMKDILLKDHRVILKKLKDMEADLKDKKEVDFSQLRDMIIKHREYEDDTFYPALDNELDEQKKQEIIDRISNPV